jgi:hypothetical protein
VRLFLGRLGFGLATGAAGLCAALHITTFITTLTLVWILPAFVLMAGSIICAKAIESGSGFRKPSGRSALVGYALLVYAVLTFVFYYRTTGGASSVSIVNGQYVSMYKSQIIRTITEREYRMIPNLWTRVMSAWVGMMAVFLLIQFPSTDSADERDT